MKLTRIIDKILNSLTWLFAGLALLALGFIIVHILMNGIPHLSRTLFAFRWTPDNVSMLPAIFNTLFIVVITLVLAVPLGIFTGIYLVEYTKKGSRLVKFIRTATELLAGIPSIVYGLFGMLFFVQFMGVGISVLAGSLTLSIMVLPLVIRTTEEALKTVAEGYREGSFALGAGKLRTIFRIVIPSAMPGIFAGVILAIGRIVGESAALILTTGTVPQMAGGLFNSGRTLSIHMWSLSGEGHHINQAYATAVVLLIFVFIINALSALVAKKLTKR